MTRIRDKADIVGKRFGRLVVLSPIRKNGRLKYKCQCDCGNITTVCRYNLLNGNTTSCGCYHREVISKIHRSHGSTPRRLYNIWTGMHSRCYDKNCSCYDRYGGRGIRICPEWRNDYPKFRDWSLSHGYSSDLSIDRINTNGDYSPDNCRWADVITQANNKHNNHYLVIDGARYSVNQAARQFGINNKTILWRLKNGASDEESILPIGEYHATVK
jgi:hypothetical protein